MILVAPHDSDWDGIAVLTGDPSWRAANMRRYWRRLENCRYRPLWRRLARYGIDPTGHGWDGWLDSEYALPQEAMRDDDLVRLVLGSARTASPVRRQPAAQPADADLRRGRPERPALRTWRVRGRLCSRRCRRQRTSASAPASGSSMSPPAIRTGCGSNCTRSRPELMLDERNRATGVEYLAGAAPLSRRPAVPARNDGVPRRLTARREVILAGGAFNSPQLLMLSGIGPGVELSAHGIPVRVDLPGVGRNLQDRYEIGVVNRLKAPWAVLDGARFERGDPLYRQWRDRRTGMYASNGAAIALIRRSGPGKPAPDLF